jgi:DNA-binding beta-propeller fold protein YncE
VIDGATDTTTTTIGNIGTEVGSAVAINPATNQIYVVNP